MTVRAKFQVVSVTDHMGGCSDVTMRPVYHGNDEAHPNRKFWEATPSGELRMTITVPKAADYFEPGAVYTLDFTREEAAG